MTQSLSQTGHASLIELLPWYVNGTLAAAEHRAVEAHISKCVECRDDVDMLSRARLSMRDNSPAPLVPPLRADTLLTALNESERELSNYGSWKWYAAAASVVLVLAAAWVMLQAAATTGGTPAIFQTATSDGAGNAIRYVVEVQFKPGTSQEVRDAGLAALGAEGGVVAQTDGSYRITLGPAPASLSELEQRIEAIESLPEIASARVVAVQLPME